MTSVKTIRWLDRWIGIPLCFLLTAVRRLTDLQKRRPAPMVRGILFVKLVEQGSTVLASAAIRRAIELEYFPELWQVRTELRGPAELGSQA